MQASLPFKDMAFPSTESFQPPSPEQKKRSHIATQIPEPRKIASSPGQEAKQCLLAAAGHFHSWPLSTQVSSHLAC